MVRTRCPISPRSTLEHTPQQGTVITSRQRHKAAESVRSSRLLPTWKQRRQAAPAGGVNHQGDVGEEAEGEGEDEPDCLLPSCESMWPLQTETLCSAIAAEEEAGAEAGAEAGVAKPTICFRRARTSEQTGTLHPLRRTRVLFADISRSIICRTGNGDTQSACAPPRCLFKNYSFTNDPPPETRYDFSKVPNTSADMGDSSLLRPSSRRQWFACIQELESLAQESLDRRATKLQVNAPSGLPLAYIADRMDIDDPLWGYQARCAKTGWLQGFITLTVFTTWTHFFEWNSTHPCSGMAAARIANSLVGKPDPAVYTSDGGETVLQLATRIGQKASDIVSWNVARYSNITVNSRIQPGTSLYVLNPLDVDTMAIEKCASYLRVLGKYVPMLEVLCICLDFSLDMDRG